MSTPLVLPDWRPVPWSDLGLRVIPPHCARSTATGLAIGMAYGVYMAASDAWLYRSVIPAWQTASVPVYALLSAFDEIVWRLMAMSAIVWSLALLAGRPRSWCYWLALNIVTFVLYPLAHLAYFVALPRVPLSAVRELSVHAPAAILWGWLYWRHGLLASMAAHIGAHLTLQPLMGFLA